MAQWKHRIGRYHYALDVTQDGHGRLDLLDDQGRAVAVLHSIDERTPLPLPRIEREGTPSVVYLHLSAMSAVLELLGSGREVHLNLDDQAPGYVTLEADASLLQAAPPEGRPS